MRNNKRTGLAGEGIDLERILSKDMPIVDALVGLPEPYRSLGLQLAVDRYGDRPFDALDIPANASFVDRASEAGITLEAWLGDGTVWSMPTAPDVTLRIETDPFEVLWMGRSFGTCLSPGDMNFWSAVVNAVDINKAVLVGRDAEGQMVCRLLLALDEQFRIITYLPYAHNKDWKFADHAASIVRELAATMGTGVTPDGRPTKLAATDWYDDGPRDLLGLRQLLAADSDFTRSLASVDADDFIAALDTSGLSASTYIGELIGRPEIQKRSELATALLDRMTSSTQLPIAAWGAVGTQARLLGNDAIERRAVREIEKFMRTTPAPEWHGHALVDANPSAVLRSLRRTRPRTVRDDTQETDRHRRELLTMALERLNRPVQAARIKV